MVPLLPGQSRESVRVGEIMVENVLLGVEVVVIVAVAEAGVGIMVLAIDKAPPPDALLVVDPGLEMLLFLLSIPPKAPPLAIPTAINVARATSSQNVGVDKPHLREGTFSL